ncbi:MAG TPA: DNA replication/repair protein RecF [Steroidobacteraceae bacterium]|nr:DNA replication/repair protein RecF [Steroidobacteraceae bacterium]
MALLSAQIEQLRCIERAELEFDSGATLITGPNGSGKTTVLEAIYLLGRGRSFRTARLETTVRHGQKLARVVGTIEHASRRVVVGVESCQGETTAHIAGSPADSLAELSAVLPVQAIDPGVHKLIEEGPIRRRRFLDWGVFHVEHGYLQAWHRFHRALRQRNAALRQQVPDTLLDAWDQEFFTSGTEVSEYRDRYFARIRQDLQSMARALLDMDVTVEYARGWPAGIALNAVLVERRALDLSRRTTTVGPHRADLDLRVNGKRARDTVSRGQQKLLAAALLLAQLAFHRREQGLKPVLLLDDPAAELDADRLGRLLRVVAELEPQLVVTALQKTSFEGLGTPRIWFHVEQGRLTRML